MLAIRKVFSGLWRAGVHYGIHDCGVAVDPVDGAIEFDVSEGYEGGGDEEGFCFHVTRLSG